MKLHDVVATIEPSPEHGLAKGQVGTIVKELDSEFVFVEFADLSGVPYALTALPKAILMELMHTPIALNKGVSG